MAYGGGIFLPSETAYKDPNRFRDVLEAEGNKQAQYLASMDQFYAQLEEMTRQFDVTTEQRERFFEEEQAFKYDELDWKSGESELDRSLRRWEVGQSTDLGYAGLDVQREGIQANSKYQQGMLDLERNKEDVAGGVLDLERDKFNYLKGIYSDVNKRTQETHDTAKNILGGGSGVQSSVPNSGGWDADTWQPGDPSFADWINQGGY